MIIGTEYEVHIMLSRPYNCRFTYAKNSFRDKIEKIFIALIQLLQLWLLNLVGYRIEFSLRVLEGPD